MPFIITGLFEHSSWTFMSRSEGKGISWDGPQGNFNGSPSLIINIWFPSPILSRSVSSPRRVWCTLTLGDSSHSSAVCQGMSETGNVLHPSTHGALMYLWNGHSRG